MLTKFINLVVYNESCGLHISHYWCLWVFSEPHVMDLNGNFCNKFYAYELPVIEYYIFGHDVPLLMLLSHNL